MASKVLEFRQPNEKLASPELLSGVTIRSKFDVGPAAKLLQERVRREGLRIIAWPDITTLEQMTDATGIPLNQCVFGWNADDVAPLQNLEIALRSQILRVCRIESEPFLINGSEIRTLWKNHYFDGIDLRDFEDLAGAKAAITIPVHMPFGQIGVAILTSIDSMKSDLSGEFDACADFLAVVVDRFLKGYARLHRDARYFPAESTLTMRQIECLRWAAFGKTDHEIGIILGVSHAGVRYHMSRASALLGAGNRTQLIFQASQLGFLGPMAPTP